MHDLLGDLADALDCDPLALLNRQWVFRRFQLDEGPRRPRSDMERGLERFLTRIRVTGNRGAEPPDEPRAWLTPHVVVEFSVAEEVVPAERHPSAPRERFVAAHNGNIQAAADEEPLLVDDAVIASELDTRGALLLRHEKILDRPIPSEARHADVVLAARYTLEAEAIAHTVHYVLPIVAG